MPLDPFTLFFEVGRLVQAVPLVMRKHRLIDAQQLCECGRVPVRVLPTFGLRCEIATLQWDRAHEAMRRMVDRAGNPGDRLPWTR